MRLEKRNHDAVARQYQFAIGLHGDDGGDMILDAERGDDLAARAKGAVERTAGEVACGAEVVGEPVGVGRAQIATSGQHQFAVRLKDCGVGGVLRSRAERANDGDNQPADAKAGVQGSVCVVAQRAEVGARIGRVCARARQHHFAVGLEDNGVRVVSGGATEYRRNGFACAERARRRPRRIQRTRLTGDCMGGRAERVREHQ